MNKKKTFATLIAVFLALPICASAQNSTADQEIEQAEQQALVTETPTEEGVVNKDLENYQQDVEVEKSRAKIQKKLCKCSYFTDVPYTERRERFGGYLGFQWGTFSPVNYQPSFNTSSFASYYSQASNSIEIVLGIKLNFAFGSIGAQITAGHYSNANREANATLTVMPVTAGIRYAIDNIFKEPYVVPYVVGGMYTGIYNETQQGLSVKGYSPFAPYFAIGALFQLDWMDRDAHESGFEDFGLENTFLFTEARSFLPATNNLPDFSTPLQIFAGLQTEF